MKHRPRMHEQRPFRDSGELARVVYAHPLGGFGHVALAARSRVSAIRLFRGHCTFEAGGRPYSLVGVLPLLYTATRR